MKIIVTPNAGKGVRFHCVPCRSVLLRLKLGELVWTSNVDMTLTCPICKKARVFLYKDIVDPSKWKISVEGENFRLQDD